MRKTNLRGRAAKACRQVRRGAVSRWWAAGLLAGVLAASASAGPAPSGGACQLNSPKGGIQHVIYIQFDNTHFRRDNPNVASDLEQMPHLLNFITGRGALMANDHTALISHTATGILTSLTGVYPDRMGQPVSNSFRYFTPGGTSRTGVSFAYWTAPLFDPAGPPFPPAAQTDLTPTMINEFGKVAPAPACDLAKAQPKSASIPMTSPVDFISGPNSTSTPGNLLNGNTDSFTDR